MSEAIAKKKVEPRKASIKKPVGGLQARRMAGVILEVLSGTMTPTEAAEAMGMSVPKYYMVESRALDGMVLACEPRKRGYVRTAERELELLKKSHARLDRECARYQALARASRRAVGLRLPKRSGTKKGKRRRKPTVRALKLAERLKPEKGAPESVERIEGKRTAIALPLKN